MHIKRIWIMFKARNWEFFRDRASFGWNFLFPFLLVAGFGILFGTFLSLLLVPVLYELTHRKAWKQQLAAGEA